MGFFSTTFNFSKPDPDYFLERRWKSFENCLDVAIDELKVKKKKVYPNKKTLTDLEMAHVAIAYNRGSFDPAKKLKQGYLNSDGKYYGELVYAFLLESKTISVAEVDDHHAARRRERRESSTALVMQYRVNARRGLNLRGGPGVKFDVLGTVPFAGHVYVLQREGDWALVDLQGDGKADGHMHTSFLDQI